MTANALADQPSPAKSMNAREVSALRYWATRGSLMAWLCLALWKPYSEVSLGRQLLYPW